MFGIDLKKRGILGMNSRNLDYIFPHNRRRDYNTVDNKLTTKALAAQAGIPVPELYGVISYQEQLKQLETILQPHRNFVIKPAQGSGGGGIMVIQGRDETGQYLKPNGKPLSLAAVRYHTSNILSGLYSLGGLRDEVIIEQCLENVPLFDALAFQGVPDIRLIIYCGVPVMAMLRLPTRASDGRANLHAGGIGVGLSIASGFTTHGVFHDRFIDRHMDTGAPLNGLQIPDWDKILDMGTRAGDTVGLGYIGIDIVLDRTAGPMLLEMNARPGISIQIANRTGLRARLEQVKRDLPTLLSQSDKIAYARASWPDN